jgi:uncharacterized membrane protein YjjP (DUF1212 family)
MPQTISTRRCLLLLGVAGLAGGRPVDEVEAELQRMGAVLGEPDVQCAATPTGLFVSLGSDEAAGFQSVAAPLRFDQTANVSRIVDRVLAGGLDADGAVAELRAVLAAPPLVSRWAAAAALVPVTVGIGLILQPSAANLLAAGLCAVLVALLIELAARSRLASTLLPVVAAFTVGCLIFLAAEGDLLEGPLRTLLPPLAVLLPGALIVTGMSELAAGAMVAGTSRLVFGSVQLLLFTFGLLAAVRVVGVSTADLSNVRVDDFGWWAPWAGLLLLGIGVRLNVSAPASALPWMLGLLALTFLAQSAGQEIYGAPAGGFAGGLTAALGAALVTRPGGPPSLVVFLPSFWLLVPGSLGLIGTTQLAADTGDGFATAMGAIAVIVAIALGVLIGSAVGREVAAHRSG